MLLSILRWMKARLPLKANVPPEMAMPDDHHPLSLLFLSISFVASPLDEEGETSSSHQVKNNLHKKNSAWRKIEEEAESNLIPLIQMRWHAV